MTKNLREVRHKTPSTLRCFAEFILSIDEGLQHDSEAIDLVKLDSRWSLSRT